MKIGEKLKKARKEFGFNIKEISELTKIPIPTLYSYENGNTKNIPHDKLNLLADIYVKDISFFIKFSNENLQIDEDRELLKSLLKINKAIIFQLTHNKKTVEEIEYYLTKKIGRFLDIKDI